ncbi:helix-turn-helix domain-containing protein [Bacillus sp. RO2]
MIGSTRETTSAVISQLKKEGIVKKTILFSVHVDKALELLNRY